MNTADQLIRDEGKRYRPYRDTVGKLTAGVGRNLDDVPFSDDEIALMLTNDIQAATTGLAKALPWTSRLDSVRLAALINMAFNLGLPSLLGFRNTLALIQSGQYTRASDEMLASKWATQVGDRAKRLAKQMATGEWQ